MVAEQEQKPITVGVVGLGRAGWDIHVARLRKDHRYQLTAVADLQVERLQEAQAEFGCQTYPDLQLLLQSANCELVTIASQSVDHGPHSIAVLQAGRHVVVEKPMAMNTEEATRMIEAAEAAGKNLFVHQNYRYHPDVHHIRQIIQSGILGDVFEIRIRVLHFARRNDWQTLKKYGGGTLNNTGPHLVDAALLLLDAPVQTMFSDLKLTTSAGDADDHAKIVLKGENGRVVDLEISTSCAFSEPAWTVLGTAGTMRCDGKTSELKYFDPSKLQPLEVYETPPEGRKYGSGEQLPWVEETRSATAEVATDFYDNVYAVLRHDAPMDITPESAREVIRVIEKAHRDNPPL